MHRIAETGEALYRGFEGADQRLKPAAQRCRNHAKGAAQLLQQHTFKRRRYPGAGGAPPFYAGQARRGIGAVRGEIVLLSFALALGKVLERALQTGGIGDWVTATP